MQAGQPGFTNHDAPGFASERIEVVRDSVPGFVVGD